MLASESLVPRPFWNDGGPLLIAPQAAVAAWEGTDAPSNGRVVSAKFRWSNENDPASDYDRACDVDPQTAAAIDIGEHWGIIIGTAAAQSAHWLPGSDADEFYAVGIEAADDASPERLRALTSEATEWRLLRAQVSVATEGLLLAHAASRLSEINERPAMMPSVDADAEPALIGDGLRYLARTGEYTVSAGDVVTAAGEYLTFIRFRAVAPAS
ncbi:MAG: immunity 21 family protein [Gemmatimonadota bacterium]|nr:immunity 21 family protein [Gemmatimonadota bacterium]